MINNCTKKPIDRWILTTFFLKKMLIWWFLAIFIISKMQRISWWPLNQNHNHLYSILNGYRISWKKNIYGKQNRQDLNDSVLGLGKRFFFLSNLCVQWYQQITAIHSNTCFYENLVYENLVYEILAHIC